ncbi:MAG: hypothetical protein RL347_964 [Actinomycetota bacterium]|jgi:hypothetical protein
MRLRDCTADATVAPASTGVITSPVGCRSWDRESSTRVASSMTAPQATQTAGTHRHDTSPTTHPVITGKHSQMNGETMPNVPNAAARALGSGKRSDSRPMPTIWIPVAAIPSMSRPMTTAGRPCAIATIADPAMKATLIHVSTSRWPRLSPRRPARKTMRSDAMGGIDRATLA